ncbi:MAG: methyltransferase domain-containing protein [Lentisphaeraceae bacterium]|nr:methyltransferase domain-containing protein [Lentisphaeraceae bacterium]
MQEVKESVRNYYSEVVKQSSDLKTSACCAGGEPPQWMKDLLAKISDEVLDRFYGCGFPITQAVDNCTVQDLGCGTGRDVYLYSQLIGANGKVIGVDMTPQQLEVARAVEAEQIKRFGYDKSNIQFIEGFIEELGNLGIEENSVDLVVSNCVVNLSPDKKAVLEGVASLLKQGGEFYFSDVFCDRRLPDELRKNEMLYGECLGGALYVNDFISLAKACGFNDPRLMAEAPITLDDEVKALTGNARFVSRTYRLFKIDGLEDNCEDYGQSAVYKGSISQTPHLFVLDDHHSFEKGRAERVCGNTADMLALSRFAPHFDIIGNKEVHFGEYPCGPTMAASVYTDETSGGDACC